MPFHTDEVASRARILYVIRQIIMLRAYLILQKEMRVRRKLSCRRRRVGLLVYRWYTVLMQLLLQRLLVLL